VKKKEKYNEKGLNETGQYYERESKAYNQNKGGHYRNKINRERARANRKQQ